MKSPSALQEDTPLEIQPQETAPVYHSYPLSVLEHIAKIAAEICRVPFAAVCLTNSAGNYLCGTFGIDVNDIPPHFLHNFYTLNNDNVFEVNDTPQDIRFSQNPIVTGNYAVKYYAGISVFGNTGLQTGAIAIMAQAAHRLDTCQKDFLRRLATICTTVWQNNYYQAEYNALKHILSHSGAYAVLDSKLNYISATTYFLNVAQITAEALEDKTIQDIALTRLNKEQTGKLLKSIKKNDVYTRYTGDEGHNEHNFSCIPYYNSEGQLLKVYILLIRGILNNTTAHELALTEEAAGTGIWRWFAATSTTEWTNGIYRLLDYEPNVAKQPDETIFDHAIDKNIRLLKDFTKYYENAEVKLYQGTKKITRKKRGIIAKESLARYIIVFNVITRKGKSKSIETVIEVETNSGHIPVKATGICRDITGAKPHSSYILPPQHIPNYMYGYIKTGKDPVITETNATIHIWSGIPEKQEMSGQPVHILFSSASATLVDDIYDLLYKHIPVNDITLTLKNAHTPLQVLVHATGEYDSEGALTGANIYLLDITPVYNNDEELKQKEAMYRELVEGSPQMVFMADNKGRFTYVNNRLKKIIGYEDADLIGKPFASIYDGEWRKKAIAFYQKQLLDKTDETTFIFPITVKSGDKLWVEQVTTLVRQNDNNTGYRFALYDITERLKTQQAMEEAARMATEAKEIQQTFLGKMSHEIRTPMNGVVGMANLLNTTELSLEQKEYVESIRESSINMIRIINDILDVTKIQSGKMIFEETEFAIKNLVNSVIFTLKAVAEQKDIQLLSQIDSLIPDLVIADPVRLNQILLNLADNALKFTEKGNVSITVLHKDLNFDNLICEFIVADTGIGIPQNKINSIFESFTQAQSDTTRKYGGTGLGLTIAKQLIEQQGGEIKVSSKVGIGTTFSFTFNFKVNRKDVPDSRQKKDIKINDLTGTRILLVEDNVMNQRVAKYTIEKWGGKITIADNGFTALDILHAEKFDLILMDIQMPDMNGLQATAKIRKDLKITIPIMAMTASVMQGERENCMKAGMNDYISKPFNPAELNKKITDLIAGNKKSTASKRVTNINYLREAVSNETAAVKEILELYHTKTPPVLALIKRAVELKQYDVLKGLIHDLKTSVGILGADKLFHLMDTIEFSLADEHPSQEAIAMINQMCNMVEQSIKEAAHEYAII